MYGHCIDILRDSELTKLIPESEFRADLKNNENKIVSEAAEKLVVVIFSEIGVVWLLCDSVDQGLTSFSVKGRVVV